MDEPLTVAGVSLTLSHSDPVQKARYTFCVGALPSVNDPARPVSVALVAVLTVMYKSVVPVAIVVFRRAAKEVKPDGTDAPSCADTGAVVRTVSVPFAPPPESVSDCAEAGEAAIAEGDGEPAALAGGGVYPLPPPPHATRAKATTATAAQARREDGKKRLLHECRRPVD